MTTKKISTLETLELRNIAEKKLKGRKAAMDQDILNAGTQKLLHELQVHQIELEMQNDELILAQADLYAARERYFDLYDLAPIGYFSLNEVGEILEANLTAASMLGTTRGELVKQPIHRFILPGHRDVYLGLRKQLFDTRTPHNCDLQMVRKDRSTLWVHLTGTAVTDVQGTPTCRVVVSDISLRKLAEEEQTKLEQQLHQAMKMEAIGRLAGGVAHDFNVQLATISGFVAMALDGVKANSPVAEMLRQVQIAAERSATLTSQLLLFSRRTLTEPKVVDLNEILLAMHQMLDRLISKDIKLTILPTKNLGSVVIDPAQFEQILINLTANARDAMPAGGEIVIDTSNVELSAEDCLSLPDMIPGPYVLLTVSDTGQGMSAEEKKHLFEPFFTTRAKDRGTGLGLATIYGAVTQAGGSISVFSENGRGTTFKIYLPRILQDPERVELRFENQLL